MHYLEPFYNWRNDYITSEDERSPFFGKEYSEFEFSSTLYNYYIHPQWDDFGSSTLFLKIIYMNYDFHYTIIELIGEWNDCLNNDIMILKREIIEVLLSHDIYKYILIGENILNFHCSDDCYYKEWYDDISDNNGWIVCLNFHTHVIEEMKSIHLDNFIQIDHDLTFLEWRTLKPHNLFGAVEKMVTDKQLKY